MTNRKRNISSVELDTDIVHSPRELTCKYEAVNTTVQPACTVLTVRLSGDSNSPLGSVPLSRVMHHCGMQRILQNLWAETWLLLTHGWGRRSTALLRTFSVWLRTSELPESLSERTTTKKKKKDSAMWMMLPKKDRRVIFLLVTLQCSVIPPLFWTWAKRSFVSISVK